MTHCSSKLQKAFETKSIMAFLHTVEEDELISGLYIYHIQHVHDIVAQNSAHQLCICLGNSGQTTR